MLRYASMTACSMAAQLMQCLVMPAMQDVGLQQQQLMAVLQLLLSWFADRNTLGYELKTTRIPHLLQSLR